jgi:hypothetical protein
MLTPIVTEIPRTLNAVAHDTFIDEARDVVARVPTRSRRAAASTRPAQPDDAGAVTHLAVAAAPVAIAGPRSTALTRAA